MNDCPRRYTQKESGLSVSFPPDVRNKPFRRVSRLLSALYSCRMRRERLILPTKARKFNILQRWRRYCYGLQVFSGPVSRIAGMPDTAPSGAVFHPFRDFYAATGLCRDASNGTPDFSTPYATCQLAHHRAENHLSFLAISRQTVAERPSPLSLTGGYHCGHIQRPAKRHMSGLTHPARPSHTAT